MYRKCVTEVSARHQKQVEESLLELMQKTPYEDITVTELCHCAGVSRRVFYHLFNSKQDALYAMLDHRILDSVFWRPDISDPTQWFFLYWKAHRHLLDALRANQMTGLLTERMIVCILNESYDLRYWLRTNGWNDETDVLIFHLSGAMGLVFRWYYSNFRESPEEMALLLRRILTSPLVHSANEP